MYLYAFNLLIPNDYLFLNQREVNAKVEGLQQNALYGDFISACGRLLTQTREQMHELETHLEKYGYTRPKGNLFFNVFTHKMKRPTHISINTNVISLINFGSTCR